MTLKGVSSWCNGGAALDPVIRFNIFSASWMHTSNWVHLAGLYVPPSGDIYDSL